MTAKQRHETILWDLANTVRSNISAGDLRDNKTPLHPNTARKTV